MKKDDAIAYYGSVKALADALGVWPQTIYLWKENVPEGPAYKLQVLTDGKLQVKMPSKGDKKP